MHRKQLPPDFVNGGQFAAHLVNLAAEVLSIVDLVAEDSHHLSLQESDLITVGRFSARRRCAGRTFHNFGGNSGRRPLTETTVVSKSCRVPWTRIAVRARLAMIVPARPCDRCLFFTLRLQILPARLTVIAQRVWAPSRQRHASGAAGSLWATRGATRCVPSEKGGEVAEQRQVKMRRSVPCADHRAHAVGKLGAAAVLDVLDRVARVHVAASHVRNKIQNTLRLSKDFRIAADKLLHTHADLDTSVREALRQGRSDARAINRCEYR